MILATTQQVISNNKEGNKGHFIHIPSSIFDHVCGGEVLPALLRNILDKRGTLPQHGACHGTPDTTRQQCSVADTAQHRTAQHQT